MKISCPNCGQHLEGDESLVGQTIECPACGTSFIFQEQSNEPAKQDQSAQESVPTCSSQNNNAESVAKLIKISCPNCGQHLEGDESLVGLTVECPACGNPLVVQEQTDGIKQPNPPNEEPQSTIDIKVVKRGRKNFGAKIWIAVAAVVACIVTVGIFLYSAENEANAVKNNTSTYTQEEKQGMGKIMMVLAQFDSGMKNMTAQLTAESDGRTAEILVAVSRLRMMDELENQDGWNACPQEFRAIMKDSYTANVKRGISDVIEQYGRYSVLNLFDRFNLPAKYRRFCEEIADAGSVSIELEQIRAINASQAFMSKYGLTDKDLMRFATEEFERTSDSRGDDGKETQASSGTEKTSIENFAETKEERLFFKTLDALYDFKNDDYLIGNPGQAYEQFERLAKSGFAYAEVAMAHILWMHEDVRRSKFGDDKAWIERLKHAANELKSPLAEFEYGFFLAREGDDRSSDYIDGMRLIEVSAIDGSQPAKDFMRQVEKLRNSRFNLSPSLLISNDEATELFKQQCCLELKAEYLKMQRERLAKELEH